MNVILLDNVENLGSIGDVVTVKPGYGRNYLIPQGKAALATRENMQQIEARYRVAAATDMPFFERLVHFWSNHFAVSADKQPVPAIVGLYENEAIRPNVNGKFADLLVAAELLVAASRGAGWTRWPLVIPA